LGDATDATYSFTMAIPGASSSLNNPQLSCHSLTRNVKCSLVGPARIAPGGPNISGALAVKRKLSVSTRKPHSPVRVKITAIAVDFTREVELEVSLD
jgi:hypothetical protein